MVNHVFQNGCEARAIAFFTDLKQAVQESSLASVPYMKIVYC